MTERPPTLRSRLWAFFAAQPVYWREAALCAPATPLILIVGVATHHLAYAAVATGAAFTVGFGAARDLRGWRWAAMIAAAFGAALAAFVGCLAGQWAPALYAASGLAAMGCAYLALVDEDLWWITLQMVIALTIAGAFPGSPSAALGRAAIVLAGGATQVLVVVILARLAPSAAGRLPPGPPRPPPERRLAIGHILRAAACVALSLYIARRFGLTNGYWAPMTAMIVLKPGLSETNVRGLARLGGTIAGGAVATFYVLAVGYGWAWLVPGVGLMAAAAFALQKAHYAILSACITATVVLLLSLAEGGGALLNAEHRLIATLIGGGMALVVARIAPHRPLTHTADRVGSSAGA